MLELQMKDYQLILPSEVNGSPASWLCDSDYLLRLVGVVQDSIARLSTGVDSKGETFYYPSSVHR